MEAAFNLTDFERKLITVMQHHNKRSQSTSLRELEVRLGHEEAKIQGVINNLIKRGWIRVDVGQCVVQKKLF